MARSARLTLCAVAATALLSACLSSPLSQERGTSRSTVIAQLGQPLSAAPLPDGGERLVYTTLPSGREAYHVDLASDGRVVRTEQVLTFKHLSAIEPGRWTAADVRAFFGTPMLVDSVASFDGTVWTYRFMEDINLRRLAHVHIDPAGIVRKVMFTDEPLPGDDRLS
ncbi:MAG: hypothetical protein EOO33_12400 [Comamonadaceae bacterium]|nr:MAG: hypothetical protein EOO33_12400 [Comamonadaceae bacterium]